MTAAKAVSIPEEHLSTFKVMCWEDNTTAKTLANLDPGQKTPLSKFYDVKVHWFPVTSLQGHSGQGDRHQGTTH